MAIVELAGRAHLRNLTRRTFRPVFVARVICNDVVASNGLLSLHYSLRKVVVIE